MTDLLPSPTQAAVFATAVLVLNATPGVDFLLALTRTLQGGVRAGVAAVLGINAGCVVHALAAAFGLAALLALHPTAFTAIQWAGAAYLAWLGLRLLRQAWIGNDGATPELPPATPAVAERVSSAPPRSQAPSKPGPRPRAWLSDFRTGLLTNLLNPKVAFFFLAFLPQFVPAASQHKTASFLLLGAWFVLQSLMFMLGLVLLISRLGRLQTGTRVRRALHTLGGALFIALAARILLSSRPGVTA